MTTGSNTQRRTGLPRPPTTFFGREDEITTLLELLRREDVSVITLTGPGGVGKTRLALEVAYRVPEQSDRTVEFVSLASVERPDQALATIGEQLGLWNARDDDLVSRIARLLQVQPTLLLLDNLEHVIDVSPDISRLVAETPGLTILATSRTPMHIAGEREYSVPQLTVARTGDALTVDALLEHESVQLFVDRARWVDSRFQIDESDTGTIAEICSRLEGIPLAIELAAARTKALPPSALLNRLDRQLALLRSDARDIPLRMRTIRATIDWSYALLQPDEQTAFRALSIFAGEFSLDAASAVLGSDEDEALDTVGSLIDKSLLSGRPPFEHRPYYRMLTAIREFGRELLVQSGEYEHVSLRHAGHQAAFAEALYPDQFSREQGRVYDLLDREHANIRQAIDWALASGEYLLAARIAAHLWQYWNVRGNFVEGRHWFERLLAQESDYPLELLPNLYYGFAILAGSSAEAEKSFEMAQRLDRIGEQTGHPRIRATAKNLLGISQFAGKGMHDSIESIQLWEELDEPVWAGMAAGEVSRYARELGRLDIAESYANLGYATLAGTGHIWGLILATSGVGRVRYLLGDRAGALEKYREGLELAQGLGDQILVLRLLEFIVDIAGSEHQYARVVRLSAFTQRMRERIAYGIRYPSEQAAQEQLLADARANLGDTSYEQLWTAGEHLGLSEARDLGLGIEIDESTQAPRVAQGTTRLTRREKDVLRLIVAGSTDQEIADRLYVSYRTITTHVTNILNKLAASSRTEAAAIAVRDHLI